MNSRQPKGRSIDHIVYSVFDLDRSMDIFEARLGLRPVFGGYHRTQGTKNALINLNDGAYLELLAADDSHTPAKQPRWMGIDVLTKEQPTRWALKSTDLEHDIGVLKKHRPAMGQIQEGSRITADGSRLQWQLSKPLSLPEVEPVPFCIDWSSSDKHPHQVLPDMGCTLVALAVTHPNPGRYNLLFEELGIDLVCEKSTEIRLKIMLDSPKGMLTL